MFDKGFRFLRKVCGTATLWRTCMFGAIVVSSGLDSANASEWGNMPAPKAWFLQSGSANHTRTVTSGLLWGLPYQSDFLGGTVSSQLEVSIAVWSYRNGVDSSRNELAQLSLIPGIRYRFDEGKSPWFVDGGLGATLMSRKYETNQRKFSTTFNFGTHLAIGRTFGDRRQHEISVRAEHFSNAGIKKPNPGENFIALRYAFVFD